MMLDLIGKPQKQLFKDKNQLLSLKGADDKDDIHSYCFFSNFQSGFATAKSGGQMVFGRPLCH
jgi:hypothetical protein